MFIIFCQKIFLSFYFTFLIHIYSSGNIGGIFGGKGKGNNGGGYGAPPANNGGGYGAPPANNGGGSYGAPPPQDNYGAPSPQDNYGAPPPQDNYGAPPSNDYSPPSNSYDTPDILTPDYNAPNQPTYGGGGGAAQPQYGNSNNNAQPGYGNGAGLPQQPNNAQAGYGNGNNPDPPTPPIISNDGWTVSNGPPATAPVAVPAGVLPVQQSFGAPGASSVETSIIEIGRNPSQNNIDSYGSPAADPIGAPDSYGSPAAEPIGQGGNSNVPAPRAPAPPAAPGSGGPVPAPQSDTYNNAGGVPVVSDPSVPAPQSDTYGAGGPVPDQTNPTAPRTNSALAPNSNSAPAVNPYSDISNSVPLKTGMSVLHIISNVFTPQCDTESFRWSYIP